MARNSFALAIVAALALTAIVFFGGVVDAAALSFHSHDIAGTALSMGAMVPGHPALRGILAARAEGGPDIAATIQRVNAAFEDFKKRYDGKLDDLQAAVDQANIMAAARAMGAGTTEAGAAPDPAYSTVFSNFMRLGNDEAQVRSMNADTGRAMIHASMNSGSDSAGGFLAPVEWDRQISSVLRPLSPMRRIATVVTTSVRAYSTLWDNRGWGSGWVGEAAARPETTATTFGQLVFGHGEIYAMPTITQQALDDALLDMGVWISDQLSGEFAYQEGPAFIAGNGVNKPYGFLTYTTGSANAAVHPAGAIPVSTVAAAAAITADELVDVVYALAAPYRQNATWLMNSATAGKIRKMKDSDNNYIWQRSLVLGQPEALLGYPVEIDENMPDLVAGAMPIAFGDFRRGYIINDRQGTRILRDPYTNKPYVNFYATKRVGGGVRDPKAFRVVKMAAS